MQSQSPSFASHDRVPIPQGENLNAEINEQSVQCAPDSFAILSDHYAMQLVYQPPTSPSESVTAADIPPEIFRNIIHYVGTGGGGRGMLEFFRYRGDLLRCSLVCVF